MEKSFPWLPNTVFDEATKKSLRKLSGAHRIKRIPPTEKKGRRHTSTVFVLIVENGSKPTFAGLNSSDVREEFYKASGAGGQHRNKTMSAVKLTHIPTGITAISADERQQQRNRSIAFERLEKRIMEVHSKDADLKNREIKQDQMDLNDAWTWTDYRDEVKSPTGRKGSMEAAMKGKMDKILG